MSLQPGDKLGPYEILAAIGAGGMGEVYRARDTRLNRDVAVKALPDHLARDPQALARFEREAKAVAALSHPNIVVLHDVGADASVNYAVTELLEGETLRERLSHGALHWRKTAEIGAAIAEGLAAAHAKGIIHQDIKPGNIFLTGDGQVKILDFGLAQSQRAALSQEEETRTLTETSPAIMGTIGYMSPEQVRGQKVEGSSDIFSLGCVLYEMVSRAAGILRQDGDGRDGGDFQGGTRAGGGFGQDKFTGTRSGDRKVPGEESGAAISFGA